ncbi:MAG: type II toxin-antitoxin system HicB family antitoxin [Elusimicrobiota bacterium]
MIREYVESAMKKTRYEIIENSEPYYGKIPVCRGVWATGKTLEECRQNLEDTLEGWILLRIRHGLSIPFE